jgi:hypothetical protein
LPSPVVISRPLTRVFAAVIRILRSLGRFLISRRARLIFLTLTGAASAVGYWIVASLASVQPPSSMFVGSVTVLESVSAKSSVSSHSVRLQLLAMPHSFELATIYTEPQAEYVLDVCGGGSFSGALLLYVDARLTNPYVEDRLDAPWKVVRDDGFLQVISFTLRETPSCATSLEGGDIQFFQGARFVVGGLLKSPVIRQSQFGLWQGPTYWESWPRMGLENPESKYVYQDEFGLSGFWTNPVAMLSVVESAEPPINMSVELARPATAPDEVNPLVWRSLAPISPTARVVNVDERSRLQTLLILMSVIFGIGASLATSILVQANQPYGDGKSGADVAPTAMPPTPTRPTRGHDSQAAMRNAQFALLGLLIGLLLGRRRGRRE